MPSKLIGGVAEALAQGRGKKNAAAAAVEQTGAVSASLQIEYRAVDSLIPYERNPRTHSEEQIAQIAASIKEFGFTNPVLLDGENGVIAGHGRLAAARSLGLKTVPCIELGHLKPEQKRSYLIADNKIAQNGLWNEEFLPLELTELKELGANLEFLGFNPMEIADITLGKDVEFKEYDESAADDVETITCPSCGHTFPK
jgi:ParB-like chromosome segregation protein Spo0J